MLRYWVFVLLAWAISFGATAGDGARVRVGLAWQPNAAACERVVLSIEAAGGEAVILPQLRPAGFEYDSMTLSPKYTDEMGVLRQEYADIVKRCTYHGTDAEALLSGVQVQRGLGTTANGAGAFGASVNMNTAFVGASPTSVIELLLPSEESVQPTIKATAITKQ